MVARIDSLPLMGRIWDFLNQDVSKAADHGPVPYYARFVMSHTLIMWAVYAVAIALMWMFVSKTLALLVLASWVVLTLYGLAAALWRRHY